MEQLALEEEDKIADTADHSLRPRRTTIASFASRGEPPVASTPKANRQNSLEADGSFNAMLKRYSATVTRPRMENRPMRHTVNASNWRVQTMPTGVGSNSDLEAAVAMDYEVVYYYCVCLCGYVSSCVCVCVYVCVMYVRVLLYVCVCVVCVCAVC